MFNSCVNSVHVSQQHSCEALVGLVTGCFHKWKLRSRRVFFVLFLGRRKRSRVTGFMLQHVNEPKGDVVNT